MDDATLVGRFDPLGNLLADGERFALDDRHRDERLPVSLIDFMNGADVGVIKRRGGLGLKVESLFDLGIAQQVIGQELQGDESVELRALGFVDRTHAALAELLEDLVVANNLAKDAGPILPWRAPPAVCCPLGVVDDYRLPGQSWRTVGLRRSFAVRWNVG